MSPHPQHSNKNPLLPVQFRVWNVVDESRKTSIIITSCCLLENVLFIQKIFLKKNISCHPFSQFLKPNWLNTCKKYPKYKQLWVNTGACTVPVSYLWLINVGKKKANSFASGVFLQVQTLKVWHNLDLFKSMFAKLTIVLKR